MKLRIALGLIAGLVIAIPAHAVDLTRLPPGPRLITDVDINTINSVIDRVNGTSAGEYTGTFDGTVGATTPSTGAFTTLTSTSGALLVTSVKSSAYPPSSGAQFFGAGTSAAPFALGTTADQTVGRLYGTATNTTGYARALDARMYFSGAGGEGEAVRAYGIVNNVTAATGGTVNGLHASLSVTGASGAVSGAGHAIRGTLELASGTTVGGTIDVLQLDTFAEGTVPATAAFLSLANSGTNKLPYLARITAPATGMFANAGTGSGSCAETGGMVATKVLLISVDGTDYWIPLCDSNS